MRTPSSLDVRIGGRLRQARKMRSLTQEALGRAIGVSLQQVQKYETGANRIAASRLYMAANLLKVTPDFFFEDAEGNETPAER